MADKKISALIAATTPLDGTEVLPIVQSGSTVKITNNDLRPKQIQSNATSGVLQVTGPAAASTRVMTTPDANFTAARTDAAQTFSGLQTFGSGVSVTSGKVTSVYSAGADFVAVFQNTTSATPYGMRILDAATPSAGYPLLQVCNSAGSSDYLRVDSSNGNTTLGIGNLAIGTAAKGVNFTANTPAAGMTSQLLNWYEEGTWTPTVSSTGGGAATYARQLGYYTRIGNRIFFQITIDLATKGTLAAGDISLTGLPYTSNATVANWSSVAPGICDGFTYPAGANQLTAIVAYNGTTVNMYWLKSGAPTVNVKVADISATARINFSGHYII